METYGTGIRHSQLENHKQSKGKEERKDPDVVRAASAHKFTKNVGNPRLWGQRRTWGATDHIKTERSGIVP